MKEQPARKVKVPTLQIPKNATPEEIKEMTKKFLNDLKSGKIKNAYVPEHEEQAHTAQS